jgi:hypothetical protein
MAGAVSSFQYYSTPRLCTFHAAASIAAIGPQPLMPLLEAMMRHSELCKAACMDPRTTQLHQLQLFACLALAVKTAFSAIVS